MLRIKASQRKGYWAAQPIGKNHGIPSRRRLIHLLPPDYRLSFFSARGAFLISAVSLDLASENEKVLVGLIIGQLRPVFLY
jgi:hypothetical protein